MMKFLILTVLALGGAQAFYDAAEEGVEATGSRAKRMVGGTVLTATTNTFSFELAITPTRATITTASAQPPTCSGVLIGDNNITGAGNLYWALTSARCALSGDNITISGGSIRADGKGGTSEFVDVSAVIVHEDFLSDGVTNDIALIPLSTIVPSTSPVITLARLPGVDDVTNSFLLASVRMAGWGYPNTAYRGTSTTLRSLTSRVLPIWACAAAHLGSYSIKSTHICSNGLINKGPCTGDSGAPLVLNSGDDEGMLVGLATNTPSSGCSYGKPGIFTRITTVLSWIVEKTGIDPDDQEAT